MHMTTISASTLANLLRKNQLNFVIKQNIIEGERHVIKQFIYEYLLDMLKRFSHLVICFDEALNKIVQMDKWI